MRQTIVGLGLLALTACGSDPSAPARNASAAAPVEAVPSEPSPAPAAATPMRREIYTKLNSATCRLVEENRDEGPYWLRRCPGHAGWQLDWSESDLRQGLTLIAPGGVPSDLNLSADVARGAFNSLGGTIEWRGRDPARPTAMIVRINVANGAEPERPDVSKLAIVRLTGAPCLVGVVEPGPGQNERARAIADGERSACLD